MGAFLRHKQLLLPRPRQNLPPRMEPSSALFLRNGLPKTGRKDELIDRVAENQVLGVPPTCDVCEKRKLVWSRGTGKFSCPGFFDDETKAFKRCKGPVGTELQRTPWQELGS